jgi:hypothetical protein
MVPLQGNIKNYSLKLLMATKEFFNEYYSSTPIVGGVSANRVQ